MNLVKSQIPNYKLQTNSKLQNSIPKQMPKYNEANRFGFYFNIEWTHKRKNSHYISMIR
ncbi:hypothetical protein D1AOALGA4SA_11 [Olavius algarvensis Delta 1 endosymbiont]|nr:hypothetical protein D1AOALGA4SA_11 [Olavius algarvensis Delta 1 endosymbiont]